MKNMNQIGDKIQEAAIIMDHLLIFHMEELHLIQLLRRMFNWIQMSHMSQVGDKILVIATIMVHSLISHTEEHHHIVQ